MAGRSAISTGRGRHVDPGMWNSLRQCNEGVLGQHLADMAGTELHLPFDDVEPLLLTAVHMLRWPDMTGRFVHPEGVSAGRVAADGLKRDSVVPHPPDGQANARRYEFR
jgi:hypothetical protein